MILQKDEDLTRKILKLLKDDDSSPESTITVLSSILCSTIDFLKFTEEDLQEYFMLFKKNYLKPQWHDKFKNKFLNKE
jgi:hypothetical protein